MKFVADHDHRKVRLEFIETGFDVKIIQTFDAESIYPVDKQRSEWQAVLDRFARYVEQQYGQE